MALHPVAPQSVPALLPVLLSVLLLLAVPTGAVQAQEGDSDGATESEQDPPERAARSVRDTLEEGNRLFRTGRLEEALAAYRTGWDPAHPDPVLAYNLGTTAHHLGRLPEAVLWYRRALDADGGGADDLWLQENLQRARDRLGALHLPPPDFSTRFSRYRTPLWILGALAAWVALGLLLSGRHTARRAADALLVFTVLAMAAALLVPRLAARPAVVLEPCGDGALPAGTEVWIRPAEDGQISVDTPDGPVLCPAGAIESVRP